MDTRRHRITADALRLAAAADPVRPPDARTAQAFLDGKPVRGRVHDLLANAARELGITAAPRAPTT